MDGPQGVALLGVEDDQQRVRLQPHRIAAGATLDLVGDRLRQRAGLSRVDVERFLGVFEPLPQHRWMKNQLVGGGASHRWSSDILVC